MTKLSPIIGQKNERLLTAHDVMEISGFKSRVTLWRKSRDPEDRFPRPYRDGTCCTRWKLSEIQEWIDQLETV